MEGRRRVLVYLVAVLAAGFGLLLRLPLWSLLGATVPYITFFPAVLLSAWVGGLGPGLLCTVLSGLMTLYLLVEPHRSFRVASGSAWLGLIRRRRRLPQLGNPTDEGRRTRRAAAAIVVRADPCQYRGRRRCRRS